VTTATALEDIQQQLADTGIYNDFSGGSSSIFRTA
jgi:hypothetical protein